jgi:hypothetical protein
VAGDVVGDGPVVIGPIVIGSPTDRPVATAGTLPPPADIEKGSP